MSQSYRHFTASDTKMATEGYSKLTFIDVRLTIPSVSPFLYGKYLPYPSRISLSPEILTAFTYNYSGYQAGVLPHGYYSYRLIP